MQLVDPTTYCVDTILILSIVDCTLLSIFTFYRYAYCFNN